MTPRRPARWSWSILGGVARGVLLVWVVALVAWPSYHPTERDAFLRHVPIYSSLLLESADEFEPPFDWRWDVAEVRGPEKYGTSWLYDE